MRALREVGGCLVRFLFIARKTVARFALSVVAATFLGLMFAKHDGRVVATLAAIGIFMAPVAAIFVIRLFVVRDGWYDDRPRVLILPVSGSTYLVALLLFADTVGIFIGALTAGMAYLGGLIFGWHWPYPVSPGLFVLIGCLLLLLLTGYQATGALISRRNDAFIITLVAGSVLTNVLGTRIDSIRAATAHAIGRDPLIATSISVLVVGLLLMFWRAVRAYDRALDFHGKA